jgi:hypothetical protein
VHLAAHLQIRNVFRSCRWRYTQIPCFRRNRGGGAGQALDH